jgi:hypothetical protein
MAVYKHIDASRKEKGKIKSKDTRFIFLQYWSGFIDSEWRAF